MIFLSKCIMQDNEFKYMNPKSGMNFMKARDVCSNLAELIHELFIINSFVFSNNSQMLIRLIKKQSIEYNTRFLM